MKNQKHTNTQTSGGKFPKNDNILTRKQLRIGAIILGASAFLPIGVIAAPIAIETVTVGDINNPADTDTNANRKGRGSVAYEYQIGKYEVTTTQYIAFLNAVGSTIVNQYGLYNAYMADTSSARYGCGITESGGTYSVISGRENKPVNYVSFWDAARFCNWLTTGNTETGVYDFASLNLNADGTPQSNGDISRNATVWNAGGVAIASEDEWYKAAYYDPNKNGPSAGGYWKYPMQGVTSPTTDDANYGSTGIGLTDVGGNPGSNYVSSYYGTFDQGGNVWEWNEAIIDTGNRGVRGGAFDFNGGNLAASARTNSDPSGEIYFIGFRVASRAPIVVPEPQTYALFGGMALLGLTLLRRRRKK